MFEQRIPVEGARRLILADMAGNVSLDGWDETDVLVRVRDGEEDQLTVEETEEGPTLSVRTSCEVRVPATLAVTVRRAKGNLTAGGLASLNAEQVRGNLKMRGIDDAMLAEVYGNLKAEAGTSLHVAGTSYGDTHLAKFDAADVQNVRGRLVIKQINQVRATRVGGDLVAKEIGETLNAEQVGGNAVLKDIGGLVTLDQVAGNLVVKNLAGGAKVSRIGGNLTFNGELGAGRSYHFQCDGNAVLRMQEGVNAHLSLTARGKILSSLDLADGERGDGRLSGTLGEGGAELVIQAGGNVIIGDRKSAGGADLGEEISRQVNESLESIDFEAIGRQVSEEMESALSRLRVKLESVDWERMGVRAQQAVERAMERMERNMDRAMEQVARQQERAQRQAERAAQRRERYENYAHRRAQAADPDWEEEMEAEAGAPDGAVGPNLDDERLSILKMVEQGQISTEEAEMLLDALE
ncbi:MAG: hypothetical protein P8129_02860 [Anaerolineae bacterium]